MDNKHSAKHPGFKAVAAKIQKREGVSKEAAQRILASVTRKAKHNGGAEKNPRLNRVKG